MADAPVLKWFGAASDADLIYKRRKMYSNKTHGREIHKKLAFSGINESKHRCFCLTSGGHGGNLKENSWTRCALAERGF